MSQVTKMEWKQNQEWIDLCEMFSSVAEKEEVERVFNSLLTLSESRVRGEERERLRQSVELFMNTHDRLDKSFKTDDFIKFVTEEI